MARATSDTVIVAVSHRGLRLSLTRALLSAGIFTALLCDGASVARLMGRSPSLVQPPRAIVAECGSASAALRLLARVEAVGWDPAMLFVVDPPHEIRREMRERGAVPIEGEMPAERLLDAILGSPA